MRRKKELVRSITFCRLLVAAANSKVEPAAQTNPGVCRVHVPVSYMYNDADMKTVNRPSRPSVASRVRPTAIPPSPPPHATKQRQQQVTMMASSLSLLTRRLATVSLSSAPSLQNVSVKAFAASSQMMNHNNSLSVRHFASGKVNKKKKNLERNRKGPSEGAKVSTS